jgi:hypothetical protein
MGWLGNDIHNDPALGGFERTGGAWNGLVDIEGLGRVVLTVSGDRWRPHEASLAMVRTAATQVAMLRDDIAQALFDHWEPYYEAEVDEAPRLEVPGDVWPHVHVVRLVVDASNEEFPVALQLTVPWDPEHTLGAHIAHGELVALSGSV